MVRIGARRVVQHAHQCVNQVLLGNYKILLIDLREHKKAVRGGGIIKLVERTVLQKVSLVKYTNT